MIDGHSHMLMGTEKRGTRRQKVEDLVEVDLDVLFQKMDEIGLD